MFDQELIGNIIQCHIDKGDPQTFVVGKLLYFDDDWFCMNDISVYGEYNGFALYRTEDLVSFDTDTRYINKMIQLLDYHNCARQDLCILSSEPLKEILEYAAFHSKVVGLELYASGFRDVNGFVAKVCNGIITMKQIDEYGQEDGCSWIEQSSITRVFLDDKESQCLKILTL